MPKKSSVEEAMDLFKAGEVHSSMIIILTEDGDRIYLHHFEDEIGALEYLEQMTASYRTDLIEKALKRSTN